METTETRPNAQPSGEAQSKKKNLIVRTLTGIVFVAVMVGGILYGGRTCGPLFLLITALSVWEFTGIVNQQGDITVNRIVTTGTAVMFYLGLWLSRMGFSLPVAYLPWLLSLLYLIVGELYLQKPRVLLNWSVSMMAQLYIALPFGLLPLVYYGAGSDLGPLLQGQGRYFVLAIFVFLWCSDTGAYCTGSLIGRHKLFPRISPAKTWEGSIGGGVLAIAVSQVFAYYLPVVSPLGWAGFALTVVVFGTWGDLVESLFKRQMGIKDSGNILPGHGGMLDRFDSSLLAIPASLCYLCILSAL